MRQTAEGCKGPASAEARSLDGDNKRELITRNKRQPPLRRCSMLPSTLSLPATTTTTVPSPAVLRVPRFFPFLKAVSTLFGFLVSPFSGQWP